MFNIVFKYYFVASMLLYNKQKVMKNKILQI